MMKGVIRTLSRVLGKQIWEDCKTLLFESKSFRNLFNKIRPEHYNDVITVMSCDELKRFLMELDSQQEERFYNSELNFNNWYRILMKVGLSGAPEEKLQWYFSIAPEECLYELWIVIDWDEKCDFLKFLIGAGRCGLADQFITAKLGDFLAVVDCVQENEREEILSLVAEKSGAFTIASILAAFGCDKSIEECLVNNLIQNDRIAEVLLEVFNSDVLLNILCGYADSVMPKLKGKMNFARVLDDKQLERILTLLIEKRVDLNQIFDLEQMLEIYLAVGKDDGSYILEVLMLTEPKYESLTSFYELLEKPERTEMIRIMIDSCWKVAAKSVLETVKKSRELDFVEEVLLKHLEEN